MSENSRVIETNYDRIKSLCYTDMAKFLADIQYDSSEPTREEVLKWLLKEVDEKDGIWRKE